VASDLQCSAYFSATQINAKGMYLDRMEYVELLAGFTLTLWQCYDFETYFESAAAYAEP